MIRGAKADFIVADELSVYGESSIETTPGLTRISLDLDGGGVELVIRGHRRARDGSLLYDWTTTASGRFASGDETPADRLAGVLAGALARVAGRAPGLPRLAAALADLPDLTDESGVGLGLLEALLAQPDAVVALGRRVDAGEMRRLVRQRGALMAAPPGAEFLDREGRRWSRTTGGVDGPAGRLALADFPWIEGARGPLRPAGSELCIRGGTIPL